MSRNRLFSVAAMQQQTAPAPVQASRQQPIAAEMMKDEKYGCASHIMALPAARLTALLVDPGASAYARAKACQRLAVVGDRIAVPALAPPLGGVQLSLSAQTPLDTIPAPHAPHRLPPTVS